MAWLNRCFVFIVMTTSAHECRQPYEHPLSTSFPDFNSPNRRSIQNYRNETPTTHMLNDKMHERSILAHSNRNIQQQHLETSSVRIENGSYKILNYPNIYSRRGSIEPTSTKDRIVFPGPTSDSYKPPEFPEECRKFGICTDIPNYPSQYINQVINEIKLTSRFLMEQLDSPEVPNIAQRVGPHEENIELCSFREEIIYPQGGFDKNGKPAVIVNSKENPVQGVRVEICDTDKSPCSNIAIFQMGYEARCSQKFLQRMLWTVDDTGKAVEKYVQVPSCCSCIGRLI